MKYNVYIVYMYILKQKHVCVYINTYIRVYFNITKKLIFLPLLSRLDKCRFISNSTKYKCIYYTEDQSRLKSLCLDRSESIFLDILDILSYFKYC